MRILLFMAAVVAVAALITPALAAIGPAPAIAWEHLYGGDSNDLARSLAPAAGGGWVVVGYSTSSASGDVEDASHGMNDVWVAGIGPAGLLLDQELLGGEARDTGGAVRRTADGGFIIAGDTYSSASGDVSGTTNGGSDIWLLKLGPLGGIQDQVLLGGHYDEIVYDVQPTADGGYIVVGTSTSSDEDGGDVTGVNHGLRDIWVVKLDRFLAIEWDRLLGGEYDEVGRAVRQTADGGYVVVGDSTSSASGDVTDVNHGVRDIWVVKLSAAGVVDKDVLLGGAGLEHGNDIQQTADDGFIIVGESYSSESGNVRGVNHGDYDLWVIKLGPAGVVQDERLLGGESFDNGVAVHQLADGGFIILGNTDSSASGDVTGTTHGTREVWAVRLDPSGAIQWQRLLGGADYDEGVAIEPAPGGGWVAVAGSRSSASGDVGETSNGQFDGYSVILTTNSYHLGGVHGQDQLPTMSLHEGVSTGHRETSLFAVSL